MLSKRERMAQGCDPLSLRRQVNVSHNIVAVGVEECPARVSAPMVLLTAGTNGTRVRQARVTFNARNGAQVLVDRSKVMVGHVLKGRPGHYLKIGPKLGMRVIRINTGPHDRA